MDESTNREKVLKKVRNALISKTPNPFPNSDMDSPVFHQSDLPLEVQFAESFTEQNGHFILCNDRIELIQSLLDVCEHHVFTDVFCIDKNLSSFFDEFEFPHQSIFEPGTDSFIQAVVVPCEALIARTGSIVFTPQILTQQKIVDVAQHIIVVAHTYQIVPGLAEALQFIKTNNAGVLPHEVFIINDIKNLTTPNPIHINKVSQQITVMLVLYDMGEKD